MSIVKKYAVLLMVLFAWSNAISANDHANVEASPFKIVLGVIENATRFEITNIRVVHRPTGALVGFSPVLPFQKAELGIPPRQLMADIAIITWTQQGKNHEVTLDIPKQENGLKGDVVLLYTVDSPGNISVKLVPAS